LEPEAIIISQDKEKEKEFWDNYSKNERDWIRDTAKEEIIREIISGEHWWEELIGRLENKTVLDIGCGNSYFVTYWQLTGNEAVGLDFSPETVKNNNMLHEKLGLKQNFYLASSEKIKAENNSLDIVHMRWVIHHIPPELMDRSILEIKRVLKPDGKFIVFETNYAYPFRWVVQTPFLQKFNFIRKYALKKGFFDPEEKALTNKGYINLLERNGFKIEKTDFDFTFFYYPVKLFTKNVRIKNFVKKVDLAISRIMPKTFSKDIKIVSVIN
jgi:SAM-dependent methyltransferase